MTTERDLRALRRRWPTVANLHRAGVPLRAVAGWLRIEHRGRGPLRTVHHPDCPTSPAEGMVGPPGSRDLLACARVREDPRWELLATLGVLLGRASYCTHVAATGMARRSWPAHMDRTALIAQNLHEAHVLVTLHVDLALRDTTLDEATRAQVRTAMRRGAAIDRPLARFSRRWVARQSAPLSEPRYLMTAAGPNLPEHCHPAVRALLATSTPVHATSRTGAHLFVARVPTAPGWDDDLGEADLVDVGPADGSITAATWEALKVLPAPRTAQDLAQAMTTARAVSSP